jgi:hypothetical protein
MYILQKSSKAMAICRNDSYYIIGFKNITSTRHVMFSADHDIPSSHFIKDNNIVIKKARKGLVRDDITLKYIDHDEFYMYPYKHMMGVVITNEIEDEDEDTITLNCHIFDPYFEVEMSREALDLQFKL